MTHGVKKMYRRIRCRVKHSTCPHNPRYHR